MIRVYVETNFLVDLLRPLPTRAAQALYERNKRDLFLIVPWCSVKEVERTLSEHIIKDDLGFADNAGSLFGQLVSHDASTWTTHGQSVHAFLAEVRALQQAAMQGVVQTIRACAATMEVIGPSDRATELTLDFSRGKRLKPFDEAILGCVLADAEKYAATGGNYFCSTNKRDFAPGIGNALQSAYDRAGLSYLSSFKVP